jgi:hypothetical protein
MATEMSKEDKLAKYYDPTLHQTIPFDNFDHNIQQFLDDTSFNPSSKCWIYQAISIEGMKRCCLINSEKDLVWTKPLKKISVISVVVKYKELVIKYKKMIYPETPLFLYFILKMYIPLLKIIETGIHTMFSDINKSDKVKMHPNYLRGKEYCIMALETIKQMILNLSEYEFNLNKDVYKTYEDTFVSAPIFVDIFFHIDIKSHIPEIESFNSMNLHDKKKFAKETNVDMYIKILELLVPNDYMNTSLRLFDFHNKLQINRYLNKLLKNAENPTYLPYIWVT